MKTGARFGEDSADSESPGGARDRRRGPGSEGDGQGLEAAVPSGVLF